MFITMNYYETILTPLRFYTRLCGPARCRTVNCESNLATIRSGTGIGHVQAEIGRIVAEYPILIGEGRTVDPSTESLWDGAAVIAVETARSVLKVTGATLIEVRS